MIVSYDLGFADTLQLAQPACLGAEVTLQVYKYTKDPGGSGGVQGPCRGAVDYFRKHEKVGQHAEDKSLPESE